MGDGMGMNRDRICYGLGAVLYAIAAYFGLKLMGAPMDAVNELLKVIALSLLFMVGIVGGMYVLIDRWSR